MKQRIKLNESKLNRAIKESIKRVMRENNEYTGQDLSYESIYDQAYEMLHKIGFQTKEQFPNSWKTLAERIGIRIDTLNETDFETLKDACEDAIYQYMKEENDSDTCLNFAFDHAQRYSSDDEKMAMRGLNESKLNRLIKESIKKVLNESYANDIEKWNFFCTNYPHDFIKQIWGGTHLETHFEDKFNYLHKTVGSYGVMTAFYLQLDGKHRRKLEQFAINCYI